jgi:hypothetical protein
MSTRTQTKRARELAAAVHCPVATILAFLKDNRLELRRARAPYVRCIGYKQTEEFLRRDDPRVFVCSCCRSFASENYGPPHNPPCPDCGSVRYCCACARGDSGPCVAKDTRLCAEADSDRECTQVFP